MAQYKITNDGVHDTIEEVFIPPDSGNRHWQQYKKWRAEPNTPDPSMNQAAWIVNEQQVIKQVFENNVAAGVVTTVNSYKFNSTPEDIQKMQMALDLATQMSATNVNVRDFDNDVHNVTVVQLQTVINDLNTNYNILLNQKWADQAAVSGGAAYMNFITTELDAHNLVVDAN